MEYIILLWKASDPSDKYWMKRKNKLDAMSLAREYTKAGFKAEIIPVSNPSFFVA